MSSKENNSAKDLGKQEVREEIISQHTGNHRGRGRTDKERRERYARYEKRKMFVMNAEKRNNQYLVAFLASDGELQEDGYGGEHDEDNFYILGGVSALVYVTEIGPLLSRHPSLSPDYDDTKEKFKGGITKIRGLKRFEKALKGLGIERVPSKKKDEIAYFKLTHVYTKNELTELANQQKLLKDELNSMVYSNVLYPSLHKLMIETRKMFLYKIMHLRHEYRTVLQYEIIKPLFELRRYYVEATVGATEPKEALLKMQVALGMIADTIGMMTEMNLWDVTFCIKVGTLVGRMQLEVVGMLNKIEREEKKAQEKAEKEQ